MPTFTLQTQVTADGFMAGPDGEMDWLTTDWSEDLTRYVSALTESVGTIVLGRALAEGFIPTWASMPDAPGAETMNNSRRVVISRSLTESPWDNAEIADGDLTEVINDLKAGDGGDIIAYGGGTLVRSLIGAGLLDDLHLLVNPTAIGAGMAVFPAGHHTDLTVVGVHPFECGVTAMHYRPVR